MPTQQERKTYVVTGRVRLSFVRVFRPYSQDGDTEGKYSVLLLIPKTDKVTIQKIRAAQRAALEAGKSSKFDGKIPHNWQDTLHDGDEDRDTDDSPEYKGHMFMQVSSLRKPGIVDKHLIPIDDEDEVYSGCYARVSMDAFPFNTKGKKGVSFGLRNIQKLADGDDLTGRTKPEDDFDSYDDDDDDDGVM